MWRSLIAFVLYLCVTAAVVAAEPVAQLSQEEQTAFDWFTTLGFPDVKRAKFVHVATGRLSQHGDDEPENHYLDGFLLEDRDDCFTVFTLSLTEDVFQKTRDHAPAHERVTYEVQDLKEGVVQYLNPRDEHAETEGSEVFWRRLLARLRSRTEVFVLAWACSRNSLNGEAHDLFTHARKMPAQAQPRGRNSRPPLHESIAEDIGESTMWRMILDFGEPSVPREELLKRFRLFVQRFPRTYHIERAKNSMAILETMVREDADHAKRLNAAKPFDELDHQEQIAELIFQLRDQNGHQFSQPGSCNVFFGFRGEDDSPAHRLLKIGHDAVPQLIEVLDDQRFTRSVGYHRDFYFSHFVLRVGDCAEQIISRIAGRGFYQRKTTSGAMLKDDQVKAVKAEIEAWYAEFREK
ncbi:MAG TPA: hypothetical protein VND64_01375 [Pirellulales bacterium]|nr:hypothetical protein [Pirellulales bacterium]